MFRKKSFVRQMGFWAVLLLALTAEGWMDALCRIFY